MYQLHCTQESNLWVLFSYWIRNLDVQFLGKLQELNFVVLSYNTRLYCCTLPGRAALGNRQHKSAHISSGSKKKPLQTVCSVPNNFRWQLQCTVAPSPSVSSCEFTLFLILKTKSMQSDQILNSNEISNTLKMTLFCVRLHTLFVTLHFGCTL